MRSVTGWKKILDSWIWLWHLEHTFYCLFWRVHDAFDDAFHMPTKALENATELRKIAEEEKHTGSLPRNSKGKHATILSISICIAAPILITISSKIEKATHTSFFFLLCRQLCFRALLLGRNS